MRFFADHCVPNAIVNALRGEGYEVIVLRDRIPKDSPDPEVIETGIFAIQLRNRPETLRRIIDNLLGYLRNNPEQRLHQGRLILVEAHRIRIRSSD